VLVLDRGELTGGSTFHSAGLVGQLRSTIALTRINMASVELYRRLRDDTGVDPGWREVGSLRLASSKERLLELRRQVGWARTFGLPLSLISAEEARSKGDFIGREALVKQKADGLTNKLVCLTLADPTVVALGGEPILAEGRTIGRVTSGGYGYTVGASIAYAYVPVASAAPGTRLAVELFGETIGAIVSREPLYEPRGQRIRGGV